MVATFEASDFGKMLHDRIGVELEPDVIIIGPSNQKDLNSVVRKELKGAKDVCKEHECVAAIPSWVSERERGAAEQLVHYLAENPVSSTPKS